MYDDAVVTIEYIFEWIFVLCCNIYLIGAGPLGPDVLQFLVIKIFKKNKESIYGVYITWLGLGCLHKKN